MSMEMIAEIHISSPPAALDYHRQKGGNIIRNFESDSPFEKNFSNFGRVITPQNPDNFLSSFSKGRVLISLIKELEQCFQIGCGCFVLPARETFLKFNESNFNTSNLIATAEWWTVMREQG